MIGASSRMRLTAMIFPGEWTVSRKYFWTVARAGGVSRVG